MRSAIKMVEIWRGSLLESTHFGHAVVCDEKGDVVQSWGNPDEIVYPRSSAKMLQALPLIESGAAASFGLKSEHLALACASHNAANIHTDRVRKWLFNLGLSDDALRCGSQIPGDEGAKNLLIKADAHPCQYHNNCSGKHSGFLTLSKHLGAGSEYIDIHHPVQVVVKEAFEEMTGESSPTWAVDGCSAPNHATSVKGLANAMAKMASLRSGTRGEAAELLVNAMMSHPELVAGEGRACTRLMRAMNGKVAIKTGAEGVFVAILPEKKLGVALKITDGATRASEVAIAAILAGLAVLDPSQQEAVSFLNAPIENWRGIQTGRMVPSQYLMN